MTAIAAPRFLFPISLAGFAGLLAACSQQATPEPEPARAMSSKPAEPAPAAQAQPAKPAAAPDADEAPAGDAPMWLDPLAGCEGGQVSTLHWSEALLAKGPVEVRFGEAADAPLFAQLGEPGSKETGPWLEPGAVFVARLADGTEVARAVAKGPGCEG